MEFSFDDEDARAVMEELGIKSIDDKDSKFKCLGPSEKHEFISDSFAENAVLHKIGSTTTDEDKYNEELEKNQYIEPYIDPNNDMSKEYKDYLDPNSDKAKEELRNWIKDFVDEKMNNEEDWDKLKDRFNSKIDEIFNESSTPTNYLKGFNRGNGQLCSRDYGAIEVGESKKFDTLVNEERILE